MNKHGKKTKSGQLLSYYLRQISEEVTEFVKGSDGEDRMVTKAEKLARMIWEDALGCTKMVKSKSGGMVETIVAPVRAAQNTIFDRTEGRVPNSSVEGSEKLTAADKVTEQGAKRIAKAGRKED